MRRGRSIVVALALSASAALPGVLATRDAGASVSIAVTWDALVRDTSLVAIVTPTDATSVWEAGRIYTYTHVHVDRVVAGTPPTGDAWVRTMGGIVGDLGQVVDGEAVLTVGRPCLLFLRAGPPGALVVTARGQGQFPVVANDKGELRLVRSSGAGALVHPRGAATVTLAADVVHGRLVDDVARDAAAAWHKAHDVAK